MAGKGNTFITDYLNLIFNNSPNPIAGLGDANGPQPSAAAGSIYVSLHTADPGPGGTQLISEISYTGYARVAVARSSGGWTISGQSVTPAANVVFGTMTAGAGGTVTFFGLGTTLNAAGILLYSGAVTPNLVVVNGFTPELISPTSVIEA